MLLDVLKRWNRWGEAKLAAGFARDITPHIVPFLESPEVVVLIGPRRAGKTTVMFQLMDLLGQKGVPSEAMLHVNFEEPALAPELSLDLLDEIYTAYRTALFPQGRVYLFLDEIQNVPQWERWVRSRNETEDVKIFITGSSSQLMSRELGTLLTGRHVSFKVLPLSFSEFLRFRQVELPKNLSFQIASLPVQHALDQFLRWGGFPEVTLAHDNVRKELLLKQYFDDVLFKDVAIRHNIRDTAMLRNLAVHLLTQTGSLISFQRISKTFGVSLELASSYCQYLQEAFLIELLPFYSNKVAERNRNPQKVHALDLGLRYVVGLMHSDDRGRIIETAVFNSLQAQKQDGIFYWKQSNEIDLLVRRGNSVEKLIQVVYEGLDKPEVQQRELNGFTEAQKIAPRAKQLIIAAKLSKKKIELPNKVKLIPLWHYLLFGDVN